eukprot:1157126-Pelagomonas_calceolata.AAC.6
MQSEPRVAEKSTGKCAHVCIECVCVHACADMHVHVRSACTHLHACLRRICPVLTNDGYKTLMELNQGYFFFRCARACEMYTTCYKKPNNSTSTQKRKLCDKQRQHFFFGLRETHAAYHKLCAHL